MKKASRRGIEENVTSKAQAQFFTTKYPTTGIDRGEGVKSSNKILKDLRSSHGGYWVGEIPYMDEVWDLVYPDRESLEKLVKLARRKRVWWRALGWSERMYLRALFMAEWCRIRSRVVLRILAPIVEKLLKALGRRFRGHLNIEWGRKMDEEAVKGAVSLMRGLAYRMFKGVAKRLSQTAQAWGNSQAWKWPEDHGFIRYLMMMSLPQNNNPYTPFTIRL